MVKRVSFGSNQVFCVQSIGHDARYTTEDLVCFWKEAYIGSMAVDDACGDFDGVDNVERCIIAVLNAQVKEEPIAEASRRVSTWSRKMARLNALVLAKEVYEPETVSIRSIGAVVCEVMDHWDNDDDDDDGENQSDSANDKVGDENDGESVGTIDWPCAQNRTDKPLHDERIGRKGQMSIDRFNDTCPSPRNTLVKKEKDKSGKWPPSFASSAANFAKNVGGTPKNSGSKRSRDAQDENISQTRRVQTRRFRNDVYEQCMIAQAMIWLARWEFRSHRLFRIGD